MEESILKVILEKSDWLIITIFVIYLAFKIVVMLIENKKAKEQEKQFKEQYEDIRNDISILSELAKNSDTKDRLIDSINQKLKIIYAQYGSELSKEAAIVVLHNIYFNYATMIANHVYDLQKAGGSPNITMSNLKNTISIANDEKMQELDLFMYRDKVLLTYTTGKIIDQDLIIECINNYSEKNGMLRKQIENLVMLEAGKIIKRL